MAVTGKTIWYYFYGAYGRLLAVYEQKGTEAFDLRLRRRNIYFAGRVTHERPPYLDERLVIQDRLGSRRQGLWGISYYPYGEEEGSGEEDDREKFATYWRDSFTGFDYARQRYYVSRSGRFLTPDPYRASAALTNPQTWNRYAYVAGDPGNFVDPLGLAGYATDELWFDGQLWVVTEVDGEGVPWSMTMAFLPLRFSQRAAALGERVLRGGGPSEDSTADGVTKAKRAAERISKRRFSDSCDRSLSKLGTSADEIRSGARHAVFMDGTLSTELYSSLYKGEAARAGETLERLYPGRTVSGYLHAHPNVGAVSDLNGNRIFVRPSYFEFIGQGYALAVVMHELVHNVTGLTDDRIQRLLGLPATGGSRNITLQLLVDCLL